MLKGNGVPKPKRRRFHSPRCQVQKVEIGALPNEVTFMSKRAPPAKVDGEGKGEGCQGKKKRAE